MQKDISKPETKKRILKLLDSGEKTRADIHENVPGKQRHIDTCLSELKKDGEAEAKKGVYSIPKSVPTDAKDAPAGAENLREASDNIETINRLLNVYDVLLDDIVATLSSELETKTTIEEKIDLIKSLRWVAATIDQLMKRWYLVHRGYDTNTRQAVEDAKEKTATRAQQEIENAPPEKQLNVIREYDESMREILENMPHAVKKENTV